MTANESVANYDHPWKAALEQYFEAFVEFFFPQAHAEINWQSGYESLDQEFQQIVREAEVAKLRSCTTGNKGPRMNCGLGQQVHFRELKPLKPLIESSLEDLPRLARNSFAGGPRSQLRMLQDLSKRFVDKLVKVWLLDGTETWLLLHTEIQSQADAGFAKRMFQYHYRIYDRYDREVVSLAVLGDSQTNWRPQAYEYGRWGCQLRLCFPIAKLLDYESQWPQLEASTNPFVVMVMAHLKTQATTQDPEARLGWKLRLIKGLYERGYSRQDILELFRLLDWMMSLPEPLELEFRDEVQRFEEEKQMPYISSIERIGRQEGREEERRAMIESILVTRFGELDEALAAIVEPLVRMPAPEATRLLLSQTKAELIERFRQTE